MLGTGSPGSGLTPIFQAGSARSLHPKGHKLPSAAARPGSKTAVGRDATAQTDAFMQAEILSWSRSRGVFAGISLQGATLRQDLDDNNELYGKAYENKEILTGKVAVAAKASKLISLLDKYSARKTG